MGATYTQNPQLFSSPDFKKKNALARIVWSNQSLNLNKCTDSSILLH